jgi:hypothetical protein
MSRSILKWLRTSFAAAVVLAVPAYAVSTMLPGSATATLAESDDPLRNGLRIVDPPVGARSKGTGVTANGDAEVELSDWTFTGKSQSSPYQ